MGYAESCACSQCTRRTRPGKWQAGLVDNAQAVLRGKITPGHGDKGAIRSHVQLVIVRAVTRTEPGDKRVKHRLDARARPGRRVLHPKRVYVLVARYVSEL